MKAVVYREYGDPSVLKVEDVEKPAVKRSDVLIKVEASAVNPVDTYFRKGIRQVKEFPHIPHFDVSGTIVELGEDVDYLKKGMRVWATNISGTCAEFVTAQADAVFPLPLSASFVEGAALAMPFMTAHLALHYRANVSPGECVLVYGGAGAVGNAAIQLAKRAGAKVIATASNEEKSDICLKAGANNVILYKKEDIVETVQQLTNNSGLDVILDMSVSDNLENDLLMVKTGGRIVTIGSPNNNTPELPWRLLNTKHASLLGVLLFTAPSLELKRAGDEISSLLQQQTITALVGATYSFEEASKAHHALENNVYNGSIVLTP
ncbi:NADPH:quinone reductase [Evansella cellulosilytica]|uniref:Alcohol dehydrogenase zinc-binding domain protein n=1 Tax=Evansella cellulosilytica (strain ATCC 21833 / DSM 2522 / FERM P-1141 / JCM 9156 / N-4) TaxID=649639 RepID=E6U205_EVAC2|nr:NADPH:quinone reductase [Evansella cellulosilytica]ADU29249.1 Alcohol dehydrogenase zinc-binding domain protein [Evansella cellulosilytica DSM 2522]